MFKKGQSGNPAGKKPGTKNRLPVNLIKKILAITEQLEAEGKGLGDCANQEPKWFFEHFVKPILPKNVEVTGADGGPIQTTVEVIFKRADGKGRVP